MDERKTISPTIGNYLRGLRQREGCSQATLSSRFNKAIAGSYIGLVENAKRLPSVEILTVYANYFEIPLRDLLDLRELTIFETFDLLGPDTPPAIKNERDMLLNKMRNDKCSYSNKVLESSADYVTKGDSIEVKIKILPSGEIQIGNDIFDVNELPQYLNKLSMKK